MCSEWFKNKNVALVGNSASLFDQEYGHEIDSDLHDVVVRMNKFPMFPIKWWSKQESIPKNTEKTHGTRIDVWAFWNTSEYKRHFSHPMVRNVRKMHMGWQMHSQARRTGVEFIYGKKDWDVLKEEVNTSNPTTGLATFSHVFHSNPKTITLYGYDWKKLPTWHDPDREKDKSCPHDFEAEMKYCHKLISENEHISLKT